MRILFNHTISGTADLIDLMRRNRPDLVVIATHARRDTPIRLSANRLLPEPPETLAMGPDAYADWLLHVAVAEGAGLIIPYRRREQLAGFREWFASRGIRLLTASDPDTIRLLEDKPSCLSRMEAAGTPVIPFRVFEGLGAYAALRQEGSLFPDHPGALCIKPVTGIFGAGFRIIRDQLPALTQLSGLSALELPDSSFRALLNALDQPEPMMLMPFLEGTERSVDFACHEGTLLGTVTRAKSGTSQHLYHDAYGEELAGLVVRTFGLTGVLNLQTIEDANGIQRLMEVNSRSSGGIGMTGLTNVNLPALLLDALNGDIRPMPARVAEEVRVGKREVFWCV